MEELLQSYSTKLIDACQDDSQKKLIEELLQEIQTIQSLAVIKHRLQSSALNCRQVANNRSLFILVFELSLDINQIPHSTLEASAKQYFQSLFPECTVQFFPKEEGVQLGAIGEVTTHTRQMRYYIKTHRNGLLTQFSRTAKRVDFVEIFMYKLLQEMGIGPEVHFFAQNAKDFYICTKDASNASPPTKFLTFAKLDTENTTKNCLQILRNMDNNNNNNNEEVIDEDTDQIMLGIVQADLVCRLFELADVLTNSGNFGFILDSDRVQKMTIIDFSPTGHYLNGSLICSGFIAGNGVFLHEKDQEAAFRYIFYQRSIDKRIELGKRAYQSLGDLTKHITTALEFVQEFVTHDEQLCMDTNYLLILQNRVRIWTRNVLEFQERLFSS